MQQHPIIMIIKVRLAHGLGINPSPLCPSVVMGQPLPLFRLYLVFSNKQYNFYNKSIRKMPIQNTAQGFKPTTSRTWVITNTTRPGLPPSSLYYLPGFSFIDTTFSCKGYFWKMFFRLSLLRRQKVFRNCNYFNFLPHLHHFCKQNTFISNRVTRCCTVAQYFRLQNGLAYRGAGRKCGNVVSHFFRSLSRETASAAKTQKQ